MNPLVVTLLSLNSQEQQQAFKLSNLSFEERIVYWTTVLMPLWWLLGIQPILYPAILVFLFLKAFSGYKLLRTTLPACIWAWVAMAIIMLWTASIALLDVGFSGKQLAAITATLSKSYVLISVCMILPFWCRLRLQVITRAVAWLSSGFLVAIVIEIAMLYGGINQALHIQEGAVPPLAKLSPGSQSLQIFFANIEPFLGVNVPRTVLYTADPPILGVCSILFFFICLGETNRRLRLIALMGSLTGLIISFSRLAWFCFPLALMILEAFRSGLFRQASLWVAASFSLFSSVLGLTIAEVIEIPLAVFKRARAASSIDRDLVVRKTLEAWQESPWIGWGYIRGSVKWYTYDIALGSFSTYASVLYLHGIVGFAMFITAMTLTLYQYLRGAMMGNILCQRAIASLVALYILFNATPLSWMAVSFWFFFCWLGAIIVETQQQSVSSWKQLSQQSW